MDPVRGMPFPLQNSPSCREEALRAGVGDNDVFLSKNDILTMAGAYL
jgi:hypothetical protein